MSKETLLFKTISRLGLADMQSLIDPSVFEIIHAEQNNLSKKELAEILYEIYDVENLLHDKTKRNILIEALDEENIFQLASKLNLDCDSRNNLWQDISRLRFSSDEERKSLYEFFGISYHGNKFLDKDINENRANEVIECSYSLFPHQIEITKRIQETLKSKKRVLVHMPTGAGKTRTAMNIICRHLRECFNDSFPTLVVWLADTEELCDQACEEFSKAWSHLGSSPVNLYRLYSSHHMDLKDIQTGFLVAGLAKLRNKFEQNQEDKLLFARRCSLIVFDEAHKILAPTYSDIVELINVVSDSSILGLSATPGRSTDKEDENNRLAAFFRYQKISLQVNGYSNPIEYLQAEGYLSKLQYNDIPNHAQYLTKDDLIAIENSNEIPSSVLDKLSKDSQRNLYLVNLILKKVSENKKIIVFACSVEHAEGLYALLRYKKITVGLVSSRINNARRQKTIQDYKNNLIQVIINFAVLTTGFDDPQTNVAIISRPTKSLTLYSQMVGRASRGTRVGGNSHSEIYTVIDDKIPAFRDLAKAFQHWENDWNNKEEGVIR